MLLHARRVIAFLLLPTLGICSGIYNPGSGSGGGGSPAGTINNANQSAVAYYSVTGSSNVISGDTNSLLLDLTLDQLRVFVPSRITVDPGMEVRGQTRLDFNGGQYNFDLDDTTGGDNLFMVFNKSAVEKGGFGMQGSSFAWLNAGLSPFATLNTNGLFTTLNENIQFNVNAGSMTGAGLSTCGDGTHALNYVGSTGLFGCQTLTSSGGGGGSSSLAINQNGVQITSPTVAINFIGPPFIVTSVGGGTTSQISLDGSSVTLQGLVTAGTLGALTTSSATATYLQNSSATITYENILQGLTQSSATATYLQLTSATVSYLGVSSAAATYLAQSSATATYLQDSSATLTYLNVNQGLTQSSATATYLQNSSATATYLQSSSATATYLNKNTGNIAFTNVDNNWSNEQTFGSSTTVTSVLGSSFTWSVFTGTETIGNDGIVTSPALKFNKRGVGFYGEANTPALLFTAGTNADLVGFLSNGPGIFQGSNGFFSFSNSATSLNSSVAQLDSGISRFSAGVIGIGTGLHGSNAGAVIFSSGTDLGQFLIISSGTPTYALSVSSTATTFHVAISTSGHFITNSVIAPVITSCGSSPNGSVVGNDNGGIITVGGTAPTACTLTFANTWGATPVCNVTDNSLTISADISTLNSTTLTLGFGVGGLAGGLIYYRCECSGSACR